MSALPMRLPSSLLSPSLSLDVPLWLLSPPPLPLLLLLPLPSLLLLTLSLDGPFPVCTPPCGAELPGVLLLDFRGTAVLHAAVLPLSAQVLCLDA